MEPYVPITGAILAIGELTKDSVVARSIYEEAGVSLGKCLVNAFLLDFYVTLSYTQTQVQQSKRVARDRASHLLQKNGYFST
jgi:hypothetical protein